jgi:Uma2 family endonuclease
MIAQVDRKRIYSTDAYLELEEDAIDRHEFLDGEIAVMAGGTPEHNEIALNVVGALRSGLRGLPFKVYGLDQRVWIPERRIFTYPDVMVTLRPPELLAGRSDTLLNPVLVVEVLSKSTQDYDRTDKFAAFRSIECFAEYVLVDQFRVYVTHFFRMDDGGWGFAEYTESDAVMRLRFPFRDSAVGEILAPIGCEVRVGDFYEDVVFAVSNKS